MKNQNNLNQTNSNNQNNKSTANQFDFKNLVNDENDINLNNTMKFTDLQNSNKQDIDYSTSTPLSNKNDKVVEKDDAKVTDIQRNHKEIDDNYQKELNKQWSLLEQITNRSMYNQVQESRQELFNASAEYRIKFYRTVLDGRLEALSEKTNTGLMMIKAEYRSRVASFMMQKMFDLANEVKFRQREFLAMMMEKHDYIQTLENYPPLKEQYVNSILTEGERYSKFLDRLIIRFENIIDEQLKKYS